MAPASKRSSYLEGTATEREPDTESAPQNSITVASGIPAAPLSSVGSETDSVHSSPAAMAQPDDNITKSGISISVRRDDRDDSADRDDRDVRAEMNERDRSSNRPMMPPMAAPPMAAPPPSRDYYHEYEFSDLDEITVRQLNEDILAYRYDLDYCRAQLEDADLTPQETRTLQLRTLDLGHQIRHCTHRIETIKAQTRKHTFRRPQGTAGPVAYAINGTNGGGRQPQNGNGGHGGGLLPIRPMTATPTLATGKRPMLDEEHGSGKRAKMASPDFDMMGGGSEEGVNTALQRLGFWKCRLCSAPKYLLAGAGRSPAAPCKWPLKDISKMITHFTEMHGEHTPSERCVELGAALAQNRGPFEYWLRRTRAQNISDGSVIDNCFATLLNGEMPDLIRRHSRAAAGMPVY